MTTIKPYLQFNGNCMESFEFYKSVLGGEFGQISHFKDMPEEEKESISEEDQGLVMHMSLILPNGTVLMGCDVIDSENNEYTEGNNFSLYVTADNNEMADSVFTALASEGQAKMPMNQTFWGSYFGVVTDKFGINWMIAHETENQSQNQAS